MRFHSTIRLNGKTACGIPVPEEVVADMQRLIAKAVGALRDGRT
jgi:hypothetical protein